MLHPLALIRTLLVTLFAVLACTSAAHAAGESIAYAGGNTNAMSAQVSFVTGTSVDSHQVERRVAPFMGGACGSYSTWGVLSAVNPVSPFVDTTLTHGSCAQYRLRVTSTSSVTTYATSASTVRVDRSAPMGTIDAGPPVIGGAAVLSGTAFDAESGVLAADLTYSGPTTGTACATLTGSPWSCTFNSYMVPDGYYTLELLVTDLAGNVGSPITRVVVVDNSLPSIAGPTFVEGTNPQMQHAVGPTMFFNPAFAGSFSVRVDASDAGSGIDHVAFPALGSGWTPGAPVVDASSPYEVSYGFTPGAASPGARTALARDFMGNDASLTFDVVADSTPPVGGSVSATGSAVASISFTFGSDAQSGVAQSYLQRRSAALVAGTCQSYGTWANLGPTNPSSPHVDTAVPASSCSEYRLVTVDNVGNQATVLGSGVVRNGGSGDTTAPAVTIDATPVSPVSGPTVPLAGTSSDAGSGVQSVAVTASGPSGSDLPICTRVAPAALSPWACTFDTTPLQDGTYVLRATAIDGAGNSRSATRTILVDNHAPVLGFPGFVEQTNPQYQHAVGSYMYFNPAFSGSFQATITATDSATGMSHVQFPTFGAGWTAGGLASAGPGPSYNAMYSWSAGASAPGFRDIVGFDVAGYASTAAQIRVQADSVPPVTLPASVTWDTAPARAALTITLPTDALSGLGDWGVQRRAAQRTPGGCGVFGTWAEIGLAYSPPNHFDSAVDTSHCYEYRVHGTDRVGNTATAAVTGPNTFGTLPGSPSGNVLVTAPNPSTISEGWPVADTYVDVHLSQQPTGLVEIVPATDAQTVASPYMLTFDQFNWQTPQRLTIAAVDDAVSEGMHVGNVSFTVASTDPNFSNAAIGAVVVPIVDNDVADLVVTGSSIDVAESGETSDTFALSLASEPTADVTVAFDSFVPGQVTVQPTTMVFTPANWNTPQTVTVTAVDDLAVEGAHVAAIHAIASSTDPHYDSLAMPPLQVDITDNDFGDPSSDTTAPIGGSVSVPHAVTNATSIPVTFSVGTDPGSGIATWQLQRRVSVLAGGQCAMYTAWSDIGGALPASPFTATLASGVCVQFRLVVTDTAGNVATWNASGIVQVDRTAPTGTVRAPHADGSDLVFDGLAQDTGSTTRVDVRLEGAASHTICTDVTPAGSTWTCRVAASQIPPGTYDVVLTVTDGAGNAVEARRSYVVAPPASSTPPPPTPTVPTPPRTPTGTTGATDTTRPVLGNVRLDALTFATETTLSWSATDDSGAAPSGRIERRSITPTGSWTTWAEVEPGTASPYLLSTGARGTTTCVRVTAVDAAGNTSMPRTACTTHPLDDRDLSASSGWRRSSSSAAFARTLSTTTSAMSTSSLATSARGWSELSLIASTCSTCGSIRVKIGQRVVDTISLRSRSARTRVVLPVDVESRRASARITIAHVAGTGPTSIDGLVIDR